MRWKKVGAMIVVTYLVVVGLIWAATLGVMVAHLVNHVICDFTVEDLWRNLECGSRLLSRRQVDGISLLFPLVSICLIVPLLIIGKISDDKRRRKPCCR